MEKKLKKPDRKAFLRRIKIVMKFPLRGRIKKRYQNTRGRAHQKGGAGVNSPYIKKFQKLPKSFCSICAESLKVKLNLYCDCFRNFPHSRCALSTWMFTSTFPTNRYICQSYIENSYKSFHCYTTRHLFAKLHSYIEDVDCIST